MPCQHARSERLQQAVQKYEAEADEAAAYLAAAEKVAAEIAAAKLKFAASDAKVKRLDDMIAASEKHIADLNFELQQKNMDVAIATLAFRSAQLKVDAMTKRMADEEGRDDELARLCREEVQRLLQKSTGSEK